jgi:hypothetical protein
MILSFPASRGGWGELVQLRWMSLETNGNAAGALRSRFRLPPMLLNPRRAGLVHDLAPLLNLALDEARKLGGRRRLTRKEAHIRQFLLALGGRDVAREFAVKLVNDQAWRASGRSEHLPGCRVVAGNRFADRRDLGHGRYALARGYAKGPNLARVDERKRGRRVAEQHLDMPADQVVECRHGALVEKLFIVKHLVDSMG